MTRDSSQAFKDRAARSILNHPVKCTAKDTGEEFEAVCANVSASGMFLLCGSAPSAGTDLAFRFVEQGIVLIHGEARVARVVASSNNLIGAGVFFTALDGPARRLIERVIDLNSDTARESAQLTQPERPSRVQLSLDLE